MKLTTLLIATALALGAESKLTIEEKLQLSRLETAAAKAQATLTNYVSQAQRAIQEMEAKAQATLTNFVSQAQRAIQEMEAKAKEAAAAHEKLTGELKKKYALDAVCTFDEAQEPKCPEKKEQ